MQNRLSGSRVIRQKRDQLVSEKYLVSVFSTTRVHFEWWVSFNGCLDKVSDYRLRCPGFEPYHGDVRFLNFTLQSTHRFFFNIILNFNNFSSLVFMSQNFFLHADRRDYVMHCKWARFWKPVDPCADIGIGTWIHIFTLRM